jgi:hypothetical protein
MLFSVLLTAGEKDSAVPGTKEIKMTVRHYSTLFESEETTYFRANARRREFRNLTASKYGPRLASIERCDLGQIFNLNLDQQQYESFAYPPKPFTKEQLAKMQETPVVPPGPPTSQIEETTTDTGERRDFLGHQARHVIVTTKETPLAGSHRYALEVVIDGWYIDLKTDISCEPWWHSQEKQKGFAYFSAGNVPERVGFVAKGNPETGFVVEAKMVIKNTYVLKDGTSSVETSKNRTVVIDFVEGPLGAGIFEVPAGFKKVQQISRTQPGGERSALSVGWQQFVLSMDDMFH